MSIRKKKYYKSGSVLVLALWTLFFLASLVVAVSVYISANVHVAMALKNRSAASFLARAGVERAIMAIKSGDTNEIGGAHSEYWSKDNKSIEGGTFSVFSYAAGEDNLQTNFGVIAQGKKTDINHVYQLKKLISELYSSEMSDRILDSVNKYRGEKKKLTRETINGRFESKYELLLVQGITPEIFIEIEPYLTVYYSNRYYGGIAEGKAMANSSSESAENPVLRTSRIAFVYDNKKEKILYWHEQD